MKKILLIIALFISTFAFSQKTSYVPGKLGVGIKTATAKVEVNGNGSSDTMLVIRNDKTGSDSVIVVNSKGWLGVGTPSPLTEMQVASSLTSSPRGIMSTQYNTGTDGARFHMRKARGTLLAPTTVVTGDMLGRLVASGYDGTNYLEMGAIEIASTGTIAATRVPTKMSFWTATDAAPSVLTERMTILPNGNVGIGMANSTYMSPKCVISGATNDLLRLQNSTAAGSVRLQFDISATQNVFAQIEATRTNRAGSGDTDLKFYTYTGGALSEKLRIRDDGLVGIGTTLPATRIHSASTITTSPRGITSSQHNDGTEGAIINLSKSYGTNAVPTVITTGADLGEIRAQGYDGTNYLDMGAIKVTSTGTIAATRVPTKMSFWTATDAAPSVLTERMTILPSGYVGIGTNNPIVQLDVRLGTIFGYRVTGNRGLFSGSESATILQAVQYSTGNVFEFGGGGVVSGVINNSGNLGLGTILPATRLHASSTLTTSPRGITSSQHNDGTEGAIINLSKSYGTNAAPTVITTGADLGEIRAQGYDGTNYLDMGAIKVTSTGTIAATRVPTKMSFWTATDAAPSVLTERMTILSNGNVGIGITPIDKFHIKGGTIFEATATNSKGSFGVDAGGAYLGSYSNVPFRFLIANGSLAPIVIGINGDVGIGNNITNFTTMAGASAIIKATGYVGFGTLSPTNLLSFSGQTAFKVWGERNTTANTAGVNMTVEAPGATLAATDKNGGDLLLVSGLATGTGKSDAIIQTVTNSTTGTTTNTASNKLQVLGRSLVDNTQAGTDYDAGSYIDITPGTSGGMIQLMIGDAQEYVWAIFTSAAVVTLITNSANVVNTNTDAKFCIVDNGATVRISNALGATLTMTGTIIYNQ